VAAVKKPGDYKRIVVKIGSSLLVHRDTGLRRDWLNSLVDDISVLRSGGSDVLVVSSGAIALGRKILGLAPTSLKLEESQAAAAAGQIELARNYSEALGVHGLSAGQVLLTLGDTEERRRYLNARATISMLLKLGAVPIINENDTVATTEIRYGDNDRLAARVASMVGADLLVLLSDVDGLYSAPPEPGNNPRFIESVPVITTEIEAMAGDVGTELSRGGMVTKIEAAKVAAQAGTTMVITSGKELNPLASIGEGNKATWFDAVDTPVNARRKWIAGQMETAGRIVVDDGAKNALWSGKSLLPAGVVKIEKTFRRGDVVEIADLTDRVLGRGLVAYDASDAKLIVGCKSDEIRDVLGYAGRSAMIHRDDMTLMPANIETEKSNA